MLITPEKNRKNRRHALALAGFFTVVPGSRAAVTKCRGNRRKLDSARA